MIRHRPALVVGALTVAAAVAAGPAVGYAPPAMRVSAVTFVALVGALATLTVARSSRVRRVRIEVYWRLYRWFLVHRPH